MQDGDAGERGQKGEEIGGCRAGAEEAEPHFIGGGFLGPQTSPHLPVRGDRMPFQGKWKENIEWDAEEEICREAWHRKFLMTMMRTPASISLQTESPFPAP
jgi:hypothetical protein